MSDQTPGPTAPNENQNTTKPNISRSDHPEGLANDFPLTLKEAFGLGLVNLYDEDGNKVDYERFRASKDPSEFIPHPDTFVEPGYSETDAPRMDDLKREYQEAPVPEKKKKKRTGLIAALAAGATAATAILGVAGVRALGGDDPAATPGPTPTMPAATSGTLPSPSGEVSPSPEDPGEKYLNEEKRAQEKLKNGMLTLGSTPISFELIKPLLRTQEEVDLVAKDNGVNYNNQFLEPNISTLYPYETRDAMNIEEMMHTREALGAVFTGSAQLEKVTGGEYDATKLYVTPEEFRAAASDPKAKDALLAKIASVPGEFVKLAVHAQVNNDPATATRLLNASRILDSQVNDAHAVVEFFGRTVALETFQPDKVLLGKADPTKPMALGSIEKGATISVPDEAEDLDVAKPRPTSLTMFTNIDRNTVRSEINADGTTTRYAGPGSRSLFQTFVLLDVSEETGVKGAATPVLVAEYDPTSAK